MILNNELFCEETTKQECKQDKWLMVGNAKRLALSRKHCNIYR